MPNNPPSILLTDNSTALEDWFAGTRRPDVWATLAWYDVLLRYRRSILGPLWLTLSMGALILGMGPLYSSLFNTPLTSFFPYLTLGIIFWNFLAGAITESCYSYTSSATYLKHAPYSLSIFPWRIICRHIIYLLHHLVLFLPVAAWAAISTTQRSLLLIPALLVVTLNLHALAITLGFLSARYRDIPQIVASVLQLLMFLTPVFWLPTSLTGRATWILINPMAAMLEILRAPLLNEPFNRSHWLLTLTFTCLNIAVAALTYARCRKRVVYWL
jgi:lipopolysaccharide transport system permease protein